MNTRGLSASASGHLGSAVAKAAIALLIGMMPMSASRAVEAAPRDPILFDVPATGFGDAGQSGPAAMSDPKTAPNRVANTINWMGHWYKADRRYDLVLEVERDFAFRHQEITVNLQFPEQILGTNDKVAVANMIVKMIRQKKYDWDIVWMDNHIYQFVAEELHDPLWGRKYLVDFEKVPGFVQSQKPFIIEDPSYRSQTGGIIVGPYIEGYYYALYYNQDLAAKIGIQVKPFGMTFDDLLSYVKTAAHYNENAKEKLSVFFDAYDLPSMEAIFQNLVKSWLDDYSAATREQSSEQKLEAMYRGLQAFEELGKYRPLIPSYATNAWFLTRDVPLNDRVLFYVSGTWMYSRWRDIDVAKATKMVPTELPVFKPVNYGLGGFIPTWAVLRDSPHREAAVRLIMAMSTPRVAERWVRYTKTPTGLAGDLSKATMGSDVYEVYQRTLSRKYGRRVHYSFNAAYLLGSHNSLLQNEIVSVLWKLLDGDMTADEAKRTILAKTK